MAITIELSADHKVSPKSNGTPAQDKIALLLDRIDPPQKPQTETHSLLPNEREGKIDTETVVNTYNIISKELPNAEPTALPAIRLMIYNFLTQHKDTVNPEDSKTLLAKARKLSDLEVQAKKENNPLPTIGIEIESPETTFTPGKFAALKILGIPTSEEMLGIIGEVSPEYSYHALTQTRMLQELIKLGIIPLTKDPITQKQTVPQGQIISMHINLGIPHSLDLEVLSKYEEDIYALNDMFAYAFSTPFRLENRTIYNSVYWNENAQPSVQNPDSLNGKPRQPARLELRAAEFRDYQAYFMLFDAQKLTASLFANMKRNEGLALNETDKMLAPIWDEFKLLSDAIMKKYDIYPNVMDVSRGIIARILRETELKNDARNLVAFFSRKIGDALKKAPVDESELVA